MAENEYLDASKARRWQSVVQAIQGKCSNGELAHRIVDCFHKTIRQIRRDLPLVELIELLDEPEQLRAKCLWINGAEDVKDRMIEAANQVTDLQGKLSCFLSQSLEACLHDVPFLVAESSSQFSVTDARVAIETAAVVVQAEVDRIAAKLAADPRWIPRRLGRRNVVVEKVDATERMLGESLLTGFRK